MDQVHAELRHARIVAECAFQKRLAQATLKGRDQLLKACPRDGTRLKRMPRDEQLSHHAKPAATHENARAAAIDNSLEIPFQMRPAKLSAFLRHLQIHMPTVAMHNAFDALAQDGGQAFRATF